MKRSLLGAALLALCTTFSPLQYAVGAEQQANVMLTGSFSAAINAFMREADYYGIPVVGVASRQEMGTDGKASTVVRKGLLYPDVKRVGYAGVSLGGTNDAGFNELDLNGFMIDWKRFYQFGWAASFRFSPSDSKTLPNQVFTNWNATLYTSDYGVLRLGNSLALGAYGPILISFGQLSNPHSSFGLNSNTPIDYTAPGISYTTPEWHQSSIAFSIGASLKDEYTIDGGWKPVGSGLYGLKKLGALIPEVPGTKPQVIQWAVSLNYLANKAPFRYRLAYAQSRAVGTDPDYSLPMRYALKAELVTAYFQPFGVTFRAQYTKNTGLGAQIASRMALLLLGLPTQFDGIQPVDAPIHALNSTSADLVRGKSHPYWNASFAVELGRFAFDWSRFSVGMGYSITQTDKYDFPAFQLAGVNSGVARVLFLTPPPGTGDGNFNTVLNYNAQITQILKENQLNVEYPPQTQNQYGRLTVQSYYLSFFFRTDSPDLTADTGGLSGFERLTFDVNADVAYSRVFMEFEGTDAQKAAGYPTTRFKLGSALNASLSFGVSYNF